MATKDSDRLKNKLIIYRLVVLGLIAFLLIKFDIVNNTNGEKDSGLYIFAIIFSLPLTMLLDKYIIRFAKNY